MVTSESCSDNLKLTLDSRALLQPHVQTPSSRLEARTPSFPAMVSQVVGFPGASGEPSPRVLIARREEKTQQLADARHQLYQLVLELQEARHNVSRRPIVWAGGGGLGRPSHRGPRPRTVTWDTSPSRSKQRCLRASCPGSCWG